MVSLCSTQGRERLSRQHRDKLKSMKIVHSCHGHHAQREPDENKAYMHCKYNPADGTHTENGSKTI